MVRIKGLIMKTYEIVEPVMLGFLTAQDQEDRFVSSEDGHLKFNGEAIYFVDKEGKSHESITINCALDTWVEQGRLREITE